MFKGFFILYFSLFLNSAFIKKLVLKLFFLRECVWKLHRENRRKKFLQTNEAFELVWNELWKLWKKRRLVWIADFCIFLFKVKLELNLKKEYKKWISQKLDLKCKRKLSLNSKWLFLYNRLSRFFSNFRNNFIL